LFLAEALDCLEAGAPGLIEVIMKKSALFCKNLFCAGLCLSALLLTSCVSVKKLNNLSKVYVTNTKQINLLPPEDIADELDDLMLFKGDFNGLAINLPALVQADSQGIYITLLNDFGTDMGSISYDGFSAQVDMAILPSKLKIEYIINDFQNAFYKEEKLRQNLKASKLDFKVLKADEGEDAAESDSGEIRQVYSGNKLIEEITINSQGAAIKNLLRGYSFSLYFLQ
jgi:hypothetical protein